MSATFYRFGLWIVLIVLALYVLSETYHEAPAVEMLNPQLLLRAGAFGVFLLAAGFVSSLLEKTASKVIRKRCVSCSRPVLSGEMFCRQHLRNMLEDEHDRTHAPRIRRS